MRSLIDWEYYKERVGNAILKIVTIPAALQGCQNPFPKVEYPEWLKKKVKDLSSIFKQKKLTDFLKSSDMSNKFTALGTASIEDIGKVKVRELTDNEIKAIEARKEKNKKVEEEKKRIQDDLDNPISIQKDFQGWLRCQKLFWRKYRKQRKEDPLSLMGKSGIISMMKNFDQVFYMNTLQILQIQKTSVPGILKVWVRLANNLMYTLNLEVYRKIYINSKVSQSDAIKVSKILPRDRSSRFKNYHLYQIEQKEEIFQNKLDDLMHYHLSNVEIDGVYETQIPLEYRLILECGNFVRPKVANKHESALNRVYKPQELVPTRCEKPEAFREITKILVYYSSTKNRHFIGLYIPSQKQVMTFAITQGKVNTSKDLSNVELKFKMTLTSLGEEERVPYESFEHKTEKELYNAFSKIDAKIREFRNKYKQAFMVIVHSVASVERLITNGLSSLAGEVPYMTANGNMEENKYPALDWIYFAATKF
jgi:DNA polymerase epsilon subunit 1